MTSNIKALVLSRALFLSIAKLAKLATII